MECLMGSYLLFLKFCLQVTFSLDCTFLSVSIVYHIFCPFAIGKLLKLYKNFLYKTQKLGIKLNYPLYKPKKVWYTIYVVLFKTAAPT